MSDPKQPDPKPVDKEQKDAEATAEEPKPKKPSGLDYVFKIAPADPKNNFDFEDVADK